MKKDCKISIVILAQKDSTNLEKAVDSALHQTFENLEIILVDTFSEDENALQKIKNKDERIKIFNAFQKPGSAAKNMAIRAASGDYILFHDQDSHLFLDLFEYFINDKKDCEIYVFNAKMLEDEPKDLIPKTYFDINIWNNPSQNLHTFSECSNPFIDALAVRNKIFSLNFLKKNNIYFDENQVFCDRLFHIESLLKSKAIQITPKTFSRTRHADYDRGVVESENVFDIFETLDKIKELFVSSGVYEDFKYAIFQHNYEILEMFFHLTRFSLKQKFFENMQSRFKNVDMKEFDISVLKQLNNFALFEQILNDDWTKHCLGTRFVPEPKTL